MRRRSFKKLSPPICRTGHFCARDCNLSMGPGCAASAEQPSHGSRCGPPARPSMCSGAVAWGERARQELRASGEKSRRRVPEARDSLSPQELQIAQMAAAGLSNREIGRRLFVSHRTVSSHLYHLFPKLGITSRAELSAALGGVASGE
jgi:DNA-binding CsgD family transcriptional regulator